MDKLETKKHLDKIRVQVIFSTASIEKNSAVCHYPLLLPRSNKTIAALLSHLIDIKMVNRETVQGSIEGKN